MGEYARCKLPDYEYVEDILAVTVEDGGYSSNIIGEMIDVLEPYGWTMGCSDERRNLHALLVALIRADVHGCCDFRLCLRIAKRLREMADHENHKRTRLGAKFCPCTACTPTRDYSCHKCGYNFGTLENDSAKLRGLVPGGINYCADCVKKDFRGAHP